MMAVLLTGAAASLEAQEVYPFISAGPVYVSGAGVDGQLTLGGRAGIGFSSGANAPGAFELEWSATVRKDTPCVVPASGSVAQGCTGPAPSTSAFGATYQHRWFRGEGSLVALGGGFSYMNVSRSDLGGSFSPHASIAIGARGSRVGTTFEARADSRPSTDGFGLLLLRFGVTLRFVNSTNVGSVPVEPAVSLTTDVDAIRRARLAQNDAMARGDTAATASYWTDDVTIRRGLGALGVGRAEYLRIVGTDRSDTSVVYTRETTGVDVSAVWPLAFETGTWRANIGSPNGPRTITGRYSAQWVRRDGRWLIRSEVFVALACEGVGCKSVALP